MCATAKTLDEIIKEAETEFRRLIEGGKIKNARQADEHAAEVAGNVASANGIEDQSSSDFEGILSAVFKIAGEEFPGDW